MAWLGSSLLPGRNPGFWVSVKPGLAQFFDWFGEEASQEPSLNLPSVGHSAWDALNYTPVVLLIAIVAALAVAALPTNTVRRLPVSAHGVVALLGSVSALLILLRIFDPPNFGSEETLFGAVKYEGTVQFPIFFALAASLGIVFGGCLAMQEEGFTLSDLRTRRHRGQGAVSTD